MCLNERVSEGLPLNPWIPEGNDSSSQLYHLVKTVPSPANSSCLGRASQERDRKPVAFYLPSAGFQE